MVKELEDEPRDEVAVVLDAVETAVAGAPPDSSFDMQVRAAGSILQAYARRGRRAVLAINSAARETRRCARRTATGGARSSCWPRREPTGRAPVVEAARGSRRRGDPVAGADARDGTGLGGARRASGAARAVEPRRLGGLRRRADVRRGAAVARAGAAPAPGARDPGHRPAAWGRSAAAAHGNGAGGGGRWLGPPSSSSRAACWSRSPGGGSTTGPTCPYSSTRRSRWHRPALPVWWARVAGAGLAALVAAGLATGLSPRERRPFDGERDFVGPLLDRVRDGILSFYDVRVPFVAADPSGMAAVTELAIFGFCLLAALGLALRRPLLAAGATAAGAAWPVTLLTGGDIGADRVARRGAARPRRRRRRGRRTACSPQWWRAPSWSPPRWRRRRRPPWRRPRSSAGRLGPVRPSRESRRRALRLERGLRRDPLSEEADRGALGDEARSGARLARDDARRLRRDRWNEDRPVHPRRGCARHASGRPVPPPPCRGRVRLGRRGDRDRRAQRRRGSPPRQHRAGAFDPRGSATWSTTPATWRFSPAACSADSVRSRATRRSRPRPSSASWSRRRSAQHPRGRRSSRWRRAWCSLRNPRARGRLERLLRGAPSAPGRSRTAARRRAQDIAGDAHAVRGRVALEAWFRRAGGFAYDEQPPVDRTRPPLVAFVDGTSAGTASTSPARWRSCSATWVSRRASPRASRAARYDAGRAPLDG